MPRPIRDQVVVITGASSGIGRCTARYLADRGARVVLTARRGWALEEVVAEITAAGGHAIAVAGDVTREEDMAEVARTAVRHFGRIDTWVNNAAIYIQGLVRDITLEEYRQVLEVDLLGVINGTRQALSVMQRQGAGVIVQVSSIVGERGAAFASPYAAAKSGIDGFTESLRVELWGTDIHISTLYAPSVDTPIYQNARAKFGTMPKPAPPVSDPIRAAEAIAELAESGKVDKYFGSLRHVYLNVGRISPRLADWFLHHTRRFALSDIPADGDNLDVPSDRTSVRGGWSRPGFRVTVRDTVKALPFESMAVALAAGFLAARILRR